MESAPPTPDPAAGTGRAGLSTAEARRRLDTRGYNELPGQKQRTVIRAFTDVLGEPMFLLLIGAASIYFLIGDRREALALVASLCIVIVITLFQERRTERTLARLRDLSSPRALVIRDGIEQRIPGRDVVPDDIVVLHEGDRVPADGMVLAATGLAIDESILTGESLPVDKPAADSVSSGTLVVSGFGTMRVTATGAATRIGQIGQALSVLPREPTPLYREVRRIVRWVAIGGLALCVAIAVIYALTRGDWPGGILAGITVAMGVLPEEFPVVLTVFLAMGAWRISRQNVLTRRMPAIETMGSVTVLAVDKTGTLTENRMQVAVVATAAGSTDLRGGGGDLDAGAQAVLETAAAASEIDAFDPMERAIHAAAASRGADVSARGSLVREYDLAPGLLAVTHVWQAAPGIQRIAVKGAPETVFDLCALPEAVRDHWMEVVRHHAAQGLRVLGVGRGTWGDDPLPVSPTGFEFEFLGLVCLADPVRSTVPPALAECRTAGIRVVMITGDHPGTALAIGRQAGFDVGGGAVTGAELQALDDGSLRARVAMTSIYARTNPGDKLRLIEALKANGEIVVMTGDGVNDAPALKAAHVGVAMGGRGTDVAREAASLVLVNDDFASLVDAVRLGRRIYDNIRHAMSYLIAVHIPIAGIGLAPVLFGWPLVLYPLHVLFMEFVIDPACSLVFEADREDPAVMRRPPRPPHARLFSAGVIRRSALLGSIALAYAISVYFLALRTLPDDQARSLTFMAMVVANLLLIFAARSRRGQLLDTLTRPNAVFWAITLVALTALAVVMYVPAAAALFAFSAPPAGAALIVGVAASIVLLPMVMGGGRGLRKQVSG